MFGSSGLNTLSEYTDISSAAAADISVESLNIFDHIEGTVDHNLMAVTPIEYVPSNTAVAELVEAPTTAEAASSAVHPVPPEVICGSYQSQSFTTEGTKKTDNIIKDIAVAIPEGTYSLIAPRSGLVACYLSRSHRR